MEKYISSPVSPTMRFIKGLFRFRSPGNKELMQESSEDEKLKQLEEKTLISSLSFAEKVSTFGLLPYLRSCILRTRYIFALWLMREASILTVLSENYKKVPKWTLSRVFAWPPLSSLLVRLDKRISAKCFPLGDISKISVKVLTGNK